MLEKLKQIGIILRILDSHDGTISLTSLAMYVVLYKLTMSPIASLQDTVPLLGTLTAYSFKKYLNSSTSET